MTPETPSSRISMRSWGLLMLGAAVVWAICPAYEARGFAAGSLLSALFSFAAWGAHRMGRPRLALALFVLGFGGCAIGVGAGLVSKPSTRRKMAESGTRMNLGAIRSALSVYYGDMQGVYPASLEALAKRRPIPHAETPEYHKRSTAAALGSLPNDSGGWLYDNDPASKGFGSIWVNCTHTDAKGSAWNSY